MAAFDKYPMTAQEFVQAVEVSEVSPAEYLEAMNGQVRLDVPNVHGERVIPMNGAVPESWGIAA